MNILVPLDDLSDSVAVLSDKDLRKQISDNKKILAELDELDTDSELEVNSEPVLAMWRGHGDAIRHYHNFCVYFARKRGLNTRAKSLTIKNFSYSMPWWWGNDRVHGSHRSSLLKKNHLHYSKFWKEEHDRSLYWPRPDEEAL
jgi:hypothetical protein